MCGIIGYVGAKPCASILLDGLKRLEYRGYDSAGLAIVNGRIQLRRSVGKLSNLEALLAEAPIEGSAGIGHTRWATHGRPSQANAHPHVVEDVAVVHNGIFENHMELRNVLESQGVRMSSDTDTEIAAHLVHQALNREGASLLEAVRETLKRIRGSYALAVVTSREPQTIIVAKNASPLVLGFGEDEMLCASDIPALLSHTRDIIQLEDGDLACITAGGAHIEDLNGRPVVRPMQHIEWSSVMAEKGGYKHFMLKEIFEQPRALEDTLRGRLHSEAATIHDYEIGLGPSALRSVQRVYLLACGTSYHSALVGRDYMESLARLSCNVELASEFRNREPVVGPGDLVIAISQSGETLDTLMAARLAKQRGAQVLAITNVLGSALARMSDGQFYTHAGPEIGVASTKCFTTQVAALLMLSIFLGRHTGGLTASRAAALIEQLTKAPQLMRQTLADLNEPMANLAKRYAHARDVLFLGRGLSYPIALEGALKLKEVSYIHAEGYAAGEMKHGPIALIDEQMPVIIIAPKDHHFDKTLSNLEEAKARDGQLVAITTSDAKADLARLSNDVFSVEPTDALLSPLLTVLPLQLFAYYVADAKGTDVDQPRNLAKTVTVE